MSELTALSSMTALLQGSSGVFDYVAAEQYKNNVNLQARLLKTESEADIADYKREADAYKASQKSAYLKSGVQISGSVLDVLDDTTLKAKAQISAMSAAADAKSRELKRQGREAMNKGRLSLLSGLANATGTLVRYSRSPAEVKKDDVTKAKSNRPPMDLSLFSLSSYPQRRKF